MEQSRLSLLLFTIGLIQANFLVSADSNHWEIVGETVYHDKVPITKYKSSLTGVTVTLGNTGNPIISGQFCVVTEPKSHDGLPHTLEHLVFLGSKKYPYNDLLFPLVERSFGSANAYVMNEATCYICTIAGKTGFKNYLGVVLDHMFFPNLREDDFLTEVHHVNGKGEDAGTVYSEMQARIDWDSRYRMVPYYSYPGANSSYSMSSGGRPENLRSTTTLHRIRQFHEKYYRPDNLNIQVMGDISAKDVFDAITEFEEDVLSSEFRPMDERPFETLYEDLTENVDKVIQYPDASAKYGHVKFIWRLPFALWENYEGFKDATTLMGHLSSKHSALDKVLSQGDNPIASSFYGYGIEWSQPLLILYIDGLSEDSIDNVENIVFSALESINEDNFDMEKLEISLNSTIIQELDSVERQSSWVHSSHALSEHVYNHDNSTFATFFQSHAKRQKGLSMDYWLGMINKTLLARPRVQLKFVPSKELREEANEAEKQRLEEQRNLMGEEGLKKAAADVKAALESKVEVPSEVLNSFEKPDASDIKFKAPIRTNISSPYQLRGFDIEAIPYQFYTHDIDSLYISVKLTFDIQDFDQTQWANHLEILSYVWTECPVEIDGEIISPDEMSKMRQKYTKHLYMSAGQGKFTISMQALREFYTEAVQLLKDILHGVQLDEKIIRQKISQNLFYHDERIQSGYSVMYELSERLNYADDYFSKIVFMNKNNVSKSLLDLEEGGIVEILENDIRQPLLRASRVTGHIGGNIVELVREFGQAAIDPWIDLFGDIPPVEDRSVRPEFARTRDFRVFDPSPRHVIAKHGASESCYMQQFIPYTVDRDTDPIHSHLVLALGYLNNELFKEVRGVGLAYGVWMSPSVSSQSIAVTLYRTAHVTKAYTKFREVLANFTESGGEDLWDQIYLDSSRGSECYRLARQSASTSSALYLSMIGVEQYGPEPNDPATRLHHIVTATKAEVVEAAQTFLKAFENPDETTLAISCAEGEMEEVLEGMRTEWGFDLIETDIDY